MNFRNVRPDAAAPLNAGAGLQAPLRRRDTVAIIVGIVVGAGSFRTPQLVAGITGDAGGLLAAWLAGAVISLIGALCYAELAPGIGDGIRVADLRRLEPRAATT